MARASKTVGTGAAAAAERARAEMARATEAQAAESAKTYGEKIADGLKVAAENIRGASGANATAVADVLEALANDETLSVLDQGDGVLDYLFQQAQEMTAMHLRPLVNSQIRTVRDAIATGSQPDGPEAVWT